MSAFNEFLPNSVTLDDQAIAVRAAVAELGRGNFHDRWDQSRQVAHLGEAALADLLALLEDEDSDWEARWFAARALGEFSHPQVIQALIATFAATTDDDLRQSVATALTQIGHPAIAALGEQLAHPALRPVAVQALARIPHPATLPLLIEATGDPRSPVRATALDALSPFADPTTWPIVERGLRDPAAAVRAAAIRGVLGLRGHLSPQTVVEALAPLVDDVDQGIAQQAIYALGRLAQPPATAVLLGGLDTRPPDPRQTALVQALLWQNSAAALTGLIEAWAELTAAARLVLIQGLPTLGADLHQRAGLTLQDWLEELPATADHSALRRHLVLALGQVGQADAEPLLRSLLHDPDRGVQIHAEAALRQLQQQQS
ncbi:HEAT repeat domain-containing protein [Leptolyngbya sp. KIOST-1]|uniref:HEAT repeat domain-containing protein n=1 Tax=Leptolyngbya sp. KIOST-1 TaxID=1229172 RepID=UPI000B1247F9|nr:HEAT repeat domain-containing protein [Leptolyngbya sp. KIOST-1]